MSHPYRQHKNAEKTRVSHIMGKAKGGAVHSDEAEDAAMIRKAMGDHDKQQHGGKHTDLKNLGSGGKSRMDKYARGGKVKHGGGKHHTKINIVVAPKAGADMPPPGMPPAGGPIGTPPAGGPPMPPKGPMPPPPSPMGGGMPGIGGMKRGGKVKSKSGLASPENLKKWSEHASSNSRYERGGKVPMKAGADSGEGRLQKVKAYGKNAKKNGA